MVARGACVVAPGHGGHVWLRGACVVAPGGCMVAPGGHAWLLWGEGACVGYDEIWRYGQ